MLNARQIAAYYSAVTSNYDAYAGNARGWHWGIWEPDVRTHQKSLIRSNEILVRGLAMSSETRVLDVGCGVGGFAVWAARKFGCRITAITICADHVLVAREYARRSGVGRLCEFLHMDMDRLRLPNARFDLVANQESFCHSLDKRRYLSAVFGLLAPGGVWRSVDWCLAGKRRRSAEFLRLRKDVYEGFHIPSCPATEQIERYLESAGFVEVATLDTTRRVLANPDRMDGDVSLGFTLAALFPQWCFPSSGLEFRSGHYRAGAAFLTGLDRGYFQHVRYHGRRPVADAAKRGGGSSLGRRRAPKRRR